MKGEYWTEAQRQELEASLVSVNTVRMFRRLLALLEVDQGRSVRDLAQELQIDRRSIYRWIERFGAEGKPGALEDRPVSGRPPKWNEQLEDWLQSALARPPLEIGYPANTWTVPLLQGFLGFHLPQPEISTRTVRRHLKELGYVWKRFRYVLTPDPEGEKKRLRFLPKSRLCQRAPRF